MFLAFPPCRARTLYLPEALASNPAILDGMHLPDDGVIRPVQWTSQRLGYFGVVADDGPAALARALEACCYRPGRDGKRRNAPAAHDWTGKPKRIVMPRPITGAHQSLDPDFIRAQLTNWQPRGAIYRPDETISWMGGGAGAFFAMPHGKDTVRLFLTGRDKTVRSRIGVVTLNWSGRPEVIDVTREPVFDWASLEVSTWTASAIPGLWKPTAPFDVYVGWNRLAGEIRSAIRSALPSAKMEATASGA